MSTFLYCCMLKRPSPLTLSEPPRPVSTSLASLRKFTKLSFKNITFDEPTGPHVHNGHECTERRGRVVNTPASYSGGPGFKSQPGDQLS
jgi:hypothetical protein